MKRPLSSLLLLAVAGCTAPIVNEPSLAPRAAEAIDPRVPVPDAVPVGSVDPALATTLAQETQAARSGVAEFDRRALAAQALALGAGDMASESWIAAEQALSQLVEQQGVTARAAANVDALAGQRLQANRWISPANQAAIRAAQDDIAAIAGPQQAIIARLTAQLAR